MTIWTHPHEGDVEVGERGVSWSVVSDPGGVRRGCVVKFQSLIGCRERMNSRWVEWNVIEQCCPRLHLVALRVA
jgi:hypothetical protein